MKISYTTPRLATFSTTTHHRGHNTNKTDPASYRSIDLNDTLAKLFKGLLVARLTTHTELLNTLTDSQLGTNPDSQTHDAIYSLFAIIQHKKCILDKPTYVSFVDYSRPTPPFIVTAYPPLSSKMTSEATCDTTSELDLTKLSSEFSTLAFPHATQSTSSEDCPKGVVLVRHYLEYLSLILFTNSEPNSSSGYLPSTAPTQPTHPQSIPYAHLDWRATLC